MITSQNKIVSYLLFILWRVVLASVEWDIVMAYLESGGLAVMHTNVGARAGSTVSTVHCTDCTVTV